MSGEINIRRIRDPDDPNVAQLVSESDEYLAALYPPESNHAEPIESLIGDHCAFFVAVVDASMVACGAVKMVDDGSRYGELKRLFVREACRGKGVATAIVCHLEEFLRENDVLLVRLEAGPMQPEALRLYRKLGYYTRGPFGIYRNDPLSVFMEKRL